MFWIQFYCEIFCSWSVTDHFILLLVPSEEQSSAVLVIVLELLLESNLPFFLVPAKGFYVVYLPNLCLQRYFLCFLITILQFYLLFLGLYSILCSFWYVLKSKDSTKFFPNRYPVGPAQFVIKTVHFSLN